jgi:biotin/methionine sulfoxide reductase
MTGRRTPTATHWGNYEVVSEAGRVVALEPASYDAEPSQIGAGLAATLTHPTRILTPMVREGWLERGPQRDAGGRGAEPFVAVPWERALDLAAAELARVKREHGNSAIFGGSYGWASAGRFHHAQSQLHRFLNCHGGYTSSVNSYSFAALEVILPHVIGGTGTSIFARGPLWHEIAEHGELMVAFGGMAAKNAQVNPGGVGRHTTVDWQRRCRAAGVRFVNISPSRIDVDEDLDADWIALRPNTDVALMLGLAHTIVASGRHDRDFLERCCVGFERFRAYLMGDADGTAKNAGWAAGVTGIDEQVIVDLAHQIVERRTVINLSWSIQRADHGEQPYWMGVALAAISGSMGLPGGGFAAGLGISQLGVERTRHAVAALPQGTNPVEHFIPVARVTDMLLSPGAEFDYDGGRYEYPDTRLVYWAGGNPFHHQQDLNRLVQAWQVPETVIVHEPWWNPLARFADIVFPVATAFERNDFAAGLGDLYITAMHKAAEPPGEVRSDYEVFAQLAGRLGIGERFTEGRTADEWVRELYERTRRRLRADGAELPPFDDLWRLGHVTTPPPDRPAAGSFAALRADPQANPLETPSGRIELFSETIDGFGYEDCPGHPTWLEPAEWLGAPDSVRLPLHLLSNQPRSRLHSQYDQGSASQASKVAGREPALMNADDAGARGISDGDVIRLFNDRGGCLAGAVLTTAVRPGVVIMATGAWYDPAEPGTSAPLDRHGNPNVLTPDRGTSRLAQGPTAQTTLIEVERAAAHCPEPRPFDPPLVS